jgi:hypothetical protein
VGGCEAGEGVLRLIGVGGRKKGGPLTKTLQCGVLDTMASWVWASLTTVRHLRTLPSEPSAAACTASIHFTEKLYTLLKLNTLNDQTATPLHKL